MRELKANPNPTTGKLNVVFNATTNERFTFVVLDVIGNVIMNEQYMATGGDNLKEFDFSHLTKGIYFIQVVNEAAESKTMKIVLHIDRIYFGNL